MTVKQNQNLLRSIQRLNRDYVKFKQNAHQLHGDELNAVYITLLKQTQNIHCKVQKIPFHQQKYFIEALASIVILLNEVLDKRLEFLSITSKIESSFGDLIVLDSRQEIM